MVKYRCTACRFKFNYLTAPKNCPFCARESTVVEEESAEDIMNDIDRFLE